MAYVPTRMNGSCSRTVSHVLRCGSRGGICAPSVTWLIFASTVFRVPCK